MKVTLDFVIHCTKFADKTELDSVTHRTNTNMAQLLLRKWVGSLKEKQEFMTGCSQ